MCPFRLAEKYRECLSNKEKILKEIEVKKEYLSSLQPRLNSIMQVSAALLYTGQPESTTLWASAAVSLIRLLREDGFSERDELGSEVKKFWASGSGAYPHA